MDKTFNTGLVPHKKMYREDGTYYTDAVGVANKRNLPRFIKAIVQELRKTCHSSDNIKDLMVKDYDVRLNDGLKARLGSQTVYDYHYSFYACVASMLVDKEWFYHRIIAGGSGNIFREYDQLFGIDLDSYLQSLSSRFNERLWFTYARLQSEIGGSHRGYRNCSSYNQFDIPDGEAVDIALNSAYMYVRNYVDMYPNVDTSYQHFGTDEIIKEAKLDCNKCKYRYLYSEILDTSKVSNEYIKLAKKMIGEFKLNDGAGQCFVQGLESKLFEILRTDELFGLNFEVGATHNIASVCYIIAQAYFFERRRGDKNTKRKYAKLMGFYIQNLFSGRNPNW